MDITLIIVLLVAYAGVMYFISIRPERKKQKQMEEALDALEAGDSIETSGGLFGVVIDISGDIIIVEFGGDRHCRIPMRKQAIVSIEKANTIDE